MLGNKHKHQSGYTILEVMIVLAVSGLIFIISLQFINGKQEKTSFTEGVNDMATKIQDVIAQVAQGQYSDVPVKCSFDGVNNITNTDQTQTGLLSGGVKQGTNPNCIFLGKIIVFQPSVFNIRKPDSTSYKIYTLAGGRIDQNGDPITYLVEGLCPPLGDPHLGQHWANPRVLENLTSSSTNPQGLTVSSVLAKNIYPGTHNRSCDPNGAATPLHPEYSPTVMIGFFQSLGNLDSSNNFESGGQSINLWWGSFTGNQPSEPSPNFKLDHNSSFHYYAPDPNTPALLPAVRIDICMNDGTQSADLVLGASNNQLKVTVLRNPSDFSAYC